MAEKTYHGSCHCGSVKIKAKIDLSKGTGRCNCTYCRKVRSWSVIIKPENFELLAGQESLSDYQFGTFSGHHLFCKNCGCRPFGRGHVEEIGGAFVSIALACLDDVDAQELIDAPVTYFDGLNNNWFNKPAEIRHL
ncbi:aldehyde-activating protein [Bdellovibrio bacteriovorus]|uniref:Aldehyde-activating protein n=1 Tax=Bdellovibrio bacteriovorus TaxID=959 RepID=A0A150WFK0_BDEBC|nr:GFA family protein [Bdellovibrio bacteriovorus]KYG61907.1 aldehyde-activating protein [Bdellovibrio bacteriovorus]